MKTTTGGYISPADAEAFYLAVVYDPAMAERYWDKIPPVIRILAVIVNGELSDKAWPTLPEWVKVASLKTTDEKMAKARNVVHATVLEIQARQDEIGEEKRDHEQQRN